MIKSLISGSFPAVDCTCGSSDAACFNIPIATSDIHYIEEGKTCFPLVRSQPVQGVCKRTCFTTLYYALLHKKKLML